MKNKQSLVLLNNFLQIFHSFQAERNFQLKITKNSSIQEEIEVSKLNDAIPWLDQNQPQPDQFCDILFNMIYIRSQHSKG